MATLEQIHNARHHTGLASRTESAVLIASNNVLNEDVGTPNHAERLACAKACLSDTSYLGQIDNLMMYSVGTNATIAADPVAATDNDIQFVVDSVYTTIAVNNPPA